MSRFGPALQRVRRLAAFAGVGLIGLTAGLLVGAVSGWLWLRTNAGNAWLRTQVEALLVPLVPGGTLSIGGLTTDAFANLGVSDVALRDRDGRALVEIGALDLQIAPWALLNRTARVRSVTATGLGLDLTIGDDGLDLLAVLGLDEPSDPNAPAWGGLPGRLLVEAIVLEDVAVRLSSGGEPLFATEGARLSATLDALHTTFAVDAIVLHAPLTAPSEGLLTVEGRVGYEVNASRLDLDNVAVALGGTRLSASGWVDAAAADLQLAAPSVDLAGLDPMIGGVGIGGQLTGSASMVGPLSAAVVRVDLDGLPGTQASAHGAVAFDWLASPIQYAGEVKVDPLVVAHVYPALEQDVSLGGTLTVDGVGFDPFSDMVLDATFLGGEQQVVGLPIGEVALRARIEGGVVTLREGSRLVGFVGEIVPEGTYVLETGQLEAVASGTVDPTWLATVGAPAEIGGSGRFTASVSGNALAEGLPAKLGAVVTMAPLTYGDLAVIDRAELRFDGMTRDMALSGGGTFTAEGVDAFGVRVATLDVPDLAAVVDAKGGLKASGNLAIGPVVAGAATGYGGARVNGGTLLFDVGRTSAGALSVTAELGLAAFNLATFPGTSGRVSARLSDDVAVLEASLLDGERALLTTEGQFDLASMAVRLDELLVAPTPRLVWVSDGPVLATLGDAGVTDARLHLVGLLGEVRVDGDLSLTGALNATVAVRELELDTFAELVPEYAGGTSGKLTMDLAISGDASAPYLLADLDARGVWAADTVRWLDIIGQVEAHSGAIFPQLVVGVAGEALADVSGMIPADLALSSVRLASEHDVDLAVTLRPGSWARLGRVVTTPLPLPDGQVSGSLTATGLLGDPDFRLAIVAELAVPGWTDPGRIELEMLREGGSLDAFAALREGFTRRATLGGAGETRLGEVFTWALDGGEAPDLADPTLYLDQMVVSTVLLGVPVRSLMRAAGVSLPLEGEFVGGVTLFGSPWAPELEGGLHWLDGRIGRIPVEGAYFSVVPGDQGLVVDLDLTFPEGGFKVVGDLPFAVDLRADTEQWVVGDLNLTVGGDGLPLAVLDGLGLGVNGGAGALVLNGTIGGSPLAPVANLNARIAKGGLTVPQLGLRFDEMKLDLGVDGRRVRLAEMRVRSQPIRPPLGQFGGDERTSRVSATGSAILDANEPAKFQGRVTLERAWVLATPQMLGRLDGSLTVGGAWPALEVRGDVELVQGRYTGDVTSFSGANPVVVDSAIVVHRGLLSQSREVVEVEPPIYADFDVKLGVSLNRNLDMRFEIPFIDDLGALGAAVTQASVEARVGGKVDVAMANADIGVLGEVDILQGRVRVLRTQFEQLSGRLVFAGGDVADPNLDLEGQANIPGAGGAPGATINLRITGTPSEPDIVFTSEEYADNTQILTMLITGRAPESMSANEGMSTAQALAGLLLNSALAGTNLGNVSIDPSGSVEIGFPISERTYAVSRFNGRATPEQNRLSVQLEWAMAPRLLWVVGAGEVYQWTDLVWERRF